jgi:two-component system LytT family response regulator
MEPIKTLIVDDEKPARSRLTLCLRREPEIEIVGIARDGLEAVKQIRALSPDLIFLDVRMPHLDGFGVINQIGVDAMPSTIFVTAYDEHAIKAIESHALDYLLKPFSDERFEAALAHARKQVALRRNDQSTPAVTSADAAGEVAERTRIYSERIAMRANGRILFLDVNQIDWIEAAGIYVNLHMGDKTYLYRSTLAQTLKRLNPRQFVRLHRSAVVNTARILELHPRGHGDYTVVLVGGKQLVLSRAYKLMLEEWLGQSL